MVLSHLILKQCQVQCNMLLHVAAVWVAQLAGVQQRAWGAAAVGGDANMPAAAEGCCAGTCEFAVALGRVSTI